MAKHTIDASRTPIKEEKVKELALEFEPLMSQIRAIAEKHNLTGEVLTVYLWTDGSIDVNSAALNGWEISQRNTGALKVKFNYESTIVKGAEENE